MAAVTAADDDGINVENSFSENIVRKGMSSIQAFDFYLGGSQSHPLTLLLVAATRGPVVMSLAWVSPPKTLENEEPWRQPQKTESLMPLPAFLVAFLDIAWCLPSPSDVFEMVSESTSNKGSLSAVVSDYAVVPQKRVLGNVYNSDSVFSDSPLVAALVDGMNTQTFYPGKTYVVVSKSQNGKSTAAMEIVSNRLEEFNCNGLYISAQSNVLSCDAAVQKLLNTTVHTGDIPSALVAALGVMQAGKEKAPSLLFLDEFNDASEKNRNFVHNIFQHVAMEQNMICVIMTNKEAVADTFLALNGGKIVPFPGFARDDWKPDSKEPTQWREIVWSARQLQALLDFKFPGTEGLSCDFLVDGMTPGHARQLALRLRQPPSPFL